MDSPHHVPLPKSFESSRTVPRLEIPCSDPTYSTVTLVEEQSRSSVQESEKQAQAIPNSRRLLRVIIIESTILVLALATLSLASAYGTQLYKAPRITDLVPSRFVMPGQVSPPISRAPLSRRAPIASYYRNTSERLTANDTQSWVIFYSGTMPLLSIIMTTVGIILAYRKKVTPLYSTILSAAFLASWCVNVGWWITCDWASTLPGGNTAPKNVFYNAFKGKECYDSFEVSAMLLKKEDIGSVSLSYSSIVVEQAR
ncbi:hypothetical protein EJ08DRAFT_666071 [Tothia fuscella]|uniref:Uncharacterized protein n=1 Tax=Tothia fuscella TaxID=1048955 RepID=A0A9P4NFN5_9PEZI|nr:hypothetical protein EJ08DRAFT_666071 [Tothia fuscella]